MPSRAFSRNHKGLDAMGQTGRVCETRVQFVVIDFLSGVSRAKKRNLLLLQ